MKQRTMLIALCLFFGLQGFQNCSKPVAFTQDASNASLGDEEEDVQNIPDEPEDPPSEHPNLVQDTVEVASTNAIDVLIVMDNSKSMKGEQANMASRFSNFLSKLNNLDWHLGIITTDVSSEAPLRNGNLVKFKNTNDYFLTSNMSSTFVNNAFSSTIQMGTTGSGSEQGIAATSKFIDRHSNTNDPVHSMLREDAVLSVTVVTDANESGSQAINNADNLIAKIKNKFGNAKRFIFNSIVILTDDTACLPQGERYGKSYEGLSKKTGGVKGSVCSMDYTSILQDIGEVTAQSINSIQLKCVPEDMNNNGSIMDDIVIKNGNTVVTGYTIVGQQARFGTGLPNGTYSVSYYCK